MPEKKVESQSQENQEEQNNSEDSTQQTNNQEPQHIDPKYVESLEARIAEQQIQNRRLEGLVEGIKATREENKPPPAPRNIEQERAGFYQDPVGALDKQLSARDERILKQMREMLEPIQSVASSFKVNNEYDRLKASIKHDPVFGKGLKDPDVETYVDHVMKSGGVELTEENIKSAISQAFGMKAMGAFGNRSSQPNNQENGGRIDPPQIPTSRTRSSVSETVQKPLTEDDRIAMKFAGLKPDNPEHVKEYWSLITNDKMTLSAHKKGE